MMEHRTLMDPYEQQLLKVFDSYDYDNKGSLDRDGLTQLCQNLQLEERGNELIKCLLNDSKHNRATFTEFKDALLALLGNIQNSENNTEIDGSPEREVSPKFVYGSKKYGRRSRPRSDEISPIKERIDIKYPNKTMNNVSVQRSNSQSEVTYSKKRKTNGNLKRCTSFPGTCEDTFVPPNNFGNQEFVCNENMLREAWRKLGVGEDGNLNQTELILVCDAIGLRELANSVIRRLPKCLSDIDYRISFHELLEVLQQDETWVDILNGVPKNCEETLNISCVSDDSLFLNSKSVQYITLGPKGNGYINIDTVVEMWEAVGITAPKLLLNDLGFTSNDIDIVELASVLEKEIKGIQDTRTDFSNPHVALLQAVLALYQSEIRYLKSVLEQMQAEREKLKGDIIEANNRASLLAQEVDDNHAKMEKNTRKQVRLLEQRHADILKEITEQCSVEKDQMSVLNRSLEERIASLECEEAKLRNDLDLAQKYLSSVEKENQNLSGQVAELQQMRELLNEQVKLLEKEKQKCHESEQVQMENLLAKLSALQVENTQLRDRNDEMQSEIENLSSELAAVRMRMGNSFNFNEGSSMDENILVVCEGMGAAGQGNKRRSDESPSKDLNVLGLGDGSPRLGKVRKFHKNRDTLEVVPFTSSESGFETELDCLDSSLSNSCNETDDVVNRLHAKIEVLEQILAEHSIPIPADYASQSEIEAALSKVRAFPEHSKRLERLLADLQDEITRLVPSADDAEAIRNRIERIVEQTARSAGEKITNDAYTETNDDNDDNATLRDKLDASKRENDALKAECEDLKQCLQLMEVEYEKCEKYWAATLEDERKVFEQEQGQYNEHLMRLTDKITEYEKDFVEKNNRLPPIEEKRKLEEQFTDLEHEFEDYKDQAEFQMDEKDREIMDLKERLEEMQILSKQTCDSITQTDPNDFKSHNLTNHVIESTNLFSEDTMPFTLSAQQNNSPDTSLIEVDPALVWSKNSLENEYQSATPTMTDTTASLPVTITLSEQPKNVKQSLSMFDLPSTSTDAISNGSQKNSTPMRPKRTRKHDRNTISQRIYKKNLEQSAAEATLTSGNKWKGTEDLRNAKPEETITIPLSTMHNINGKIHHLEQKCRHLQMVLKQQHYHAEQILQHCWQQQRDEKMQLQYLLKGTQEKLDRQIRLCNEQLERLARTDLLVKDLYVENAFLVANVQRLEQKCHLLSQCNLNNSV